jgi:hypothetical protein
LTVKLSEQSNHTDKQPEGRILKVTPLMSGHVQVKIDNGPTNTITIMARLEDAELLLSSDLLAIRNHLMTPRRGRFRVKE